MWIDKINPSISKVSCKYTFFLCILHVVWFWRFHIYKFLIQTLFKTAYFPHIGSKWCHIWVTEQNTDLAVYALRTQLMKNDVTKQNVLLITRDRYLACPSQIHCTIGLCTVMLCSAVYLPKQWAAEPRDIGVPNE